VGGDVLQPRSYGAAMGLGGGKNKVKKTLNKHINKQKTI
jgi:hypothetical protein